ncbi:MAG: hypothetical protein AVDCRST_MAG50-385, partial [uncultured Acidimicrobiales bacterium]
DRDPEATPPGPAQDRDVPSLRHPHEPAGAGRAAGPDHRGLRCGGGALPRARRRSRHAAQAGGAGRLPLRCRLVGHRPAVGGRPVRELLPPAHRAGGAGRRRRHAPRVPRDRRLPVDRHARGRVGRGRADRRSSQWPSAGRRPWSTGPVAQPGPVRLHQHQAPLPDRGPHLRAGGPRLGEHHRSSPEVPSPGPGLGRGASRLPAGPAGASLLPRPEGPPPAPVRSRTAAL